VESVDRGGFGVKIFSKRGSGVAGVFSGALEKIGSTAPRDSGTTEGSAERGSASIRRESKEGADKRGT
jgi:hypothetical protein